LISNTWFLFDDCSFTKDSVNKQANEASRSSISKYMLIPWERDWSRSTQEWLITSFATSIKENAEFCHIIARRRRWRGHSDCRVHVIHDRKYPLVLLIETENNLQNVIVTFSENCGQKLSVELKCVRIILPCEWCQNYWKMQEPWARTSCDAHVQCSVYTDTPPVAGRVACCLRVICELQIK
jgi:hypothetical protein